MKKQFTSIFTPLRGADALSRRRAVFLGTSLAALILTVGASTWALQQKSDPVPFRPGIKGQPADLPRGEVLLFQFLQKLADATGEQVYFNGDSPPDARIVLPRALSTLDLKTAQEVLSKEGFELSQETYRGKRVYWVQRSLVPPGRKGRIVRDGRQDGDEPSPARPSSKGVPGTSKEGSQLRFYRREDGAGTGSRFLLIFETDSQSEAEEVQSLIQAHQRSKARKQ